MRESKIMASNGSRHVVSTMAELEALYSDPVHPPAKTKETDRITNAYRALIEASPFFALATCGPDGLDCSPRGDPKGFVRVLDDKTIVVPDRRGNNRIDSLRNLIHDPRVALLFLIPGVSETLRIVGRATISTEPELCASFAMQGKAPRSVLVIAVDRVFFQCAKAIVRSKLWDPATQADRSTLPTSGKILAEISRGTVDADAHDRAYPERLKATIY
jgi:PPOX class probable FMN-dependent enzyme